MITKQLIVLLILASLAPYIHADETSQRQSAEQLLKVMDLEKTTMAGVNAMFELQLQQNPMLLPYRDVFQKWAKSFLTWDVIGPQVADLYAAAFTEDELHEIAAFYASPTGQKTLMKAESLFRESAQIGRRLAEQHQAELEEMIRQRAQELQQATTPGDGSAAPN